jgi:hypothetical protein
MGGHRRVGEWGMQGSGACMQGEGACQGRAEGCRRWWQGIVSGRLGFCLVDFGAGDERGEGIR